MKRPAISEAAFQRALIEFLNWRGYRCYHTRFSVGSDTGYPDVTAFGPGGRVLVIECKRRGGKRTPRQVEWGDHLLANGHEYYCWTPDDWPLIEAVINREVAQ